MNRGRGKKSIRTAAVVTALGVVTGAGPANLALAAGGKKAPTPAAAAKQAAPAAEGTKVPDDTGNGRRIGLRDALKVAVRQNPGLASETVDVGIADAQIVEISGLHDWFVSAGASWLSSRSDVVPGQSFATLAADTFNLNAGITKPLADGGTISLNASHVYDRRETRSEFTIPGVGTAIDVSETTVYNPKLALTFNQPILRGFGEKNRRTASGLTTEGVEAERNVQVLERENAAGNLVRDVVQAYWELAYAAQEVEIRKQSLALAREQLRITQAGIDVGKLAKTESLSVEQAIASREEELLIAEQNLSDRSIELRRLVGMEIGPGEIELTAVDRLETDASDPNVDKVLADAMSNNPQLKVVRAQGKSAAIVVEVTDNGLLPQLDFTASGGPQGNADNLNDAFSNMATFDSFEVSAGLTYNQTLGNHASKGASEQARGRLRKAKLTEQDISAQIAAQAVRAVNVVRSAKKRMEVSSKASTLAKQNVDLEKARWEVGRTTNFEVLKRQDELAQSQLREARARADYLKAVSVVDSLTGSILPRYGIALAK
jgi:outer membrane protein TolC